MGIPYPDNQNRANRAQQLTSVIAQLQTQVRQALDDAKIQDERAIVILDKIAKQRGFKTFDEYIKNIESKLSSEEKKRYDDMKKEFEKKDKDLDNAMKAGTGLIGVGLAAGLAPASITILLQRNMIIFALRAVGIGLLKVITGQLKEGIAFFKAADRLLSTIMEGEKLAGKIATAFRALKIAGKILSVTFDDIWIFQIVDGGKQCSELQEVIKGLCIRRMTTEKIHQYTRATLIFSSEAKAMADLSETLQRIVASGAIKQEVADAAVADRMKELEPKITKDIEGVTDKSVYDLLARLDRESQIAWTDEDPSLDWMINKIEEDIKKEVD